MNIKKRERYSIHEVYRQALDGRYKCRVGRKWSSKDMANMIRVYYNLAPKVWVDKEKKRWGIISEHSGRIEVGYLKPVMNSQSQMDYEAQFNIR